MWQRWLAPDRVRHLVQDEAVGVGFLLLWWLIEYWFVGAGWQPTSLGTFHLAVWATAFGLATRRTCPTLALFILAVAYPLAYAIVSSSLENPLHLAPLVLAAHSAAVQGRLHQGWVMAITGAATLSLVAPWDFLPRALSLVDQPDRLMAMYDLSGILVTEFAVIAVVMIGAATRAQVASAAVLTTRNAELERLRRVEAAQVVAGERARIARELHDVIAHHVSAIVIRCQAAERVSSTHPQEALATVSWVSTTGQEALAAMRQIVRVLRSQDGSRAGELAPRAGMDLLAEIAERVQAAGLPVHVNVPSELPALSPNVELATVRIVQEALTNALVHAHATKAAVTLRVEDGTLLVVVEDDGTTGGPPAATPTDMAVTADGSGGQWRVGHGLLGMQERAVRCGGRVSLQRSALGGWRVGAELPLPAESPVAARPVTLTPGTADVHATVEEGPR